MEHRMLLDRTVRSSCRLGRNGNRAFTLVELMIVVSIVGVLAVIAVVGYRRYILNAKITEAQDVISAIKIAQEDHRAERGMYADLGASTYCPEGAGVSNRKIGWNPACSGGVAPWTTLPVHVTGAVQFSYATVAGTAWTEPPGTDWVAWNSPTASMWYVVMARCDLEPGGEATMLVGSSLQSSIFTHNAGE